MEIASFAGEPFQQTWRDLPHWENFFNLHPCRSVVELGTGQGGMSLFFAAQAAARGMRFTTFDRVQICKSSVLVTLHRLNAKYHHADIFAEQDFVRGVLAQQDAPTVLFCDNGDKPREFKTFAPMLRSGDFVAVHDWNAEIRIDDIVPPFPMILEKECAATDSITRFFAVP